LARAPQPFYPALYEVAKGSVTRAREGAEFIEKAAAGIATVYAAILGVAFSVSDNPLPFRGVLPAVFLGLALIFAACYLAYPGQPADTPRPSSTTPVAWFNAFADWMGHLTLYRGRFLRAALLSLLFAVIFLPTPFLAVKTTPPDAPGKADWPSANGNPELEKILYQAQVKEVAKLRDEAAPIPKGQHKIREWWIWAAGLLCLLILGVSLALPFRRGGGSGGSASAGGGGSPSSVFHPVPYFAVEDEDAS